MNFYRQKIFIKSIYYRLNYNLHNKTITLFGYSFKKDTDDIRNSVSINIASKLLKEGCYLNIYDPKVSFENIKSSLSPNYFNRVFVFKDPYSPVQKTDVVITPID
jgi:UDPglucose 6-dehydrogenase